MLEGSVSFTQCALNENMSTFSVYKNTMCMNTMCPFGFSGNKYSVYEYYVPVWIQQKQIQCVWAAFSDFFFFFFSSRII